MCVQRLPRKLTEQAATSVACTAPLVFDAPLQRAHGAPPDENVLLLPHRLPQGLAQCHLGEVLQRRVDGVPDGLVEDALHPAHEHLQAFYHGDHLARQRARSASLYLGTPVRPVLHLIM